MTSTDLILRLEHSGRALAAALEGVTPAESKWKPTPGGTDWSIVEIVNHLADEEVEDFRTRLRLTLESPLADWPKIDPVGAAIARKYQDRDLAESIARFATARKESLAWLRSLRNLSLNQVHTHPKLGSMRAGDLLASWTAHDLLHVRQITKRRYQYLRAQVEPFKLDYAGEW